MTGKGGRVVSMASAMPWKRDPAVTVFPTEHECQRKCERLRIGSPKPTHPNPYLSDIHIFNAAASMQPCMCIAIMKVSSGPGTS